MGCGVYYQQLKELDRALGSLRKLGLGELNPVYSQLSGLRTSLTQQVGIKYPRTIIQLIKMLGLSPGELRLWEDVESGWMIETRERPGAPPVYHYVNDEIAGKVILGTLTHEEFAELAVPDPYLGE